MKSGAEDDLFSDSTGADDSDGDADTDDGPDTPSQMTSDTQATASDTTTASGSGTSASTGRPYIIRRAMQDGDIKFERPNRVAMFVHDELAVAERQLLDQLHQDLTPEPKTLDVREAMYRAALEHPDAVVQQLLEMGYDATE